MFEGCFGFIRAFCRLLCGTGQRDAQSGEGRAGGCGGVLEGDNDEIAGRNVRGARVHGDVAEGL